MQIKPLLAAPISHLLQDGDPAQIDWGVSELPAP